MRDLTLEHFLVYNYNGNRTYCLHIVGQHDDRPPLVVKGVRQASKHLTDMVENYISGYSPPYLVITYGAAVDVVRRALVEAGCEVREV